MVKCGCILKKHAVFGFLGDKRPTCCKSCKLSRMVNIKHPKCGCSEKKIPYFGYPGGKATCCKKEGMVDIIHHKCGCPENRQPRFGFLGGKPKCCKSCKLPDMINIIDKICSCESKKKPCFGFAEDDRPTCCKKCKKEGMVDIINKKCGCSENRYSGFGFIGDDKPTCCKSCIKPGMINLINKTCECPENRRPAFGFIGDGKATCCKKCKKPGMKNIVTPTCNCESKKQPIFGFPGERPTCCYSCKTDDMIDRINDKNMCSMNCGTRANSKKYQGYCFNCFINTYPDNEIVRNYKVKERHFTDYVEKLFPGKFTFDKRIDGGCSGRRPDMFLDLLTHTIHVEIDEHDHIDRESTCESAKITGTFVDLAERPMVLIRLNPDKYSDVNGKKVGSCFKYHKTTGACMIRDKKELSMRQETLISRLRYWMSGYNIPDKSISIEHHYGKDYDMTLSLIPNIKKFTIKSEE